MDGQPNRPVIGQQAETFTCYNEIAPGNFQPCTDAEFQLALAAWLIQQRHVPTPPRHSDESDDAVIEVWRDRADYDRDMRESRRELDPARREVDAVHRAWGPNRRGRHRRH